MRESLGEEMATDLIQLLRDRAAEIDPREPTFLQAMQALAAFEIAHQLERLAVIAERESAA